MDINLDQDHLKGFIESRDFNNILPDVKKAHNDLTNNASVFSFRPQLEAPSRRL